MPVGADLNSAAGRERRLRVIEDDYETEVSFSGLPNPALKSLDRSGRVIYVGSLSKSLAPGCGSATSSHRLR